MPAQSVSAEGPEAISSPGREDGHECQRGNITVMTMSVTNYLLPHLQILSHCGLGHQHISHEDTSQYTAGSAVSGPG